MGSTQLKYTEDRTPSSLNPIFADDMYSVRITELIFEPLIGWDKEQKPTPMLATSWEISPDRKIITLNLRQNVKWHDGKPFSSKDVIFTINAMTSSRSQITDRYLAQIIQKVTAVGEHQVKIFFHRPLNKPLRWLQFKIIPAHRFPKGQVLRSDYFGQRPYGTGPFAFERWVSRKVILKRFAQHWRADQISLSGVILQAIADKNIQVEVLRYGGIDAIIRVRPKDIPIFERDQNLRLYPYSTNDWWYIAYNLKSGSIFSDKRVREALVYALDRDSLRAAHLGEGHTISGPFSPNDPLCNFSVMPRTQDLDKANQLLDQAGWKRSGNEIRRKANKPLEIRMLVPKSKESYKALCLGMQSAWRQIGVQLELTWLDDAAWTQAVMTRKDFDLAIHIWNFDDLSTIYPLFHSKGIHNYVSYRNDTIDKLLLQATQTTDPAIYKAIYGRIHQILHDDVPYIFLWSLTNYSSLSARVRNVHIHPFNYFHYAYSWNKGKRE
jgi:peptide/nickel transport system substrate-binding protein